MPGVLPMKKLISIILLLLAYVLFIGGGFQSSRSLGFPSLFWGIAASLVGQVALFVAGDISRPRRGKLGFFRAVAFMMFVVWSLAAPVMLLRILYWEAGPACSVTSFELAWGAVQAFSGIGFLLASLKRWKLLARYRENNRIPPATAPRSRTT
jgi:hypothetical protein